MPAARFYPSGVRRFVLLLGIAASLAGCAGSHGSEPPWVASGVKTLRAYFVGNPRPNRITWGRAARRDWVAVTFASVQTCQLCHGPRGSVVTGRRATITWLHGRHKVTSISIQKH